MHLIHDACILSFQSLERFMKEFDAASRSLDELHGQTSDQLNQSMTSSSQLDLNIQQQTLNHQAISAAEKLAYQG